MRLSKVQKEREEKEKKEKSRLERARNKKVRAVTRSRNNRNNQPRPVLEVYLRPRPTANCTPALLQAMADALIGFEHTGMPVCLGMA